MIFESEEFEAHEYFPKVIDWNFQGFEQVIIFI